MANHFKGDVDPLGQGDTGPFAQPDPDPFADSGYDPFVSDGPNPYLESDFDPFAAPPADLSYPDPQDPDPFAHLSRESLGQQGQGGYADAHARQGSRRRTRRVWPFVVVAVLLVILATGGVCAWQIMESSREVKANARSAMGFMSSYVDALKDGDSELLEQSARGASENAHAIRDVLQSPAWTVGSYVPVVGSDIGSVRVLGDVLVDVADNALVPLAQNSGGLDISNLMSDGAINVEVVRDLADAIEEVGPVIQRAAKTVDELPEAHLEQVASVVDNVKGKFAGAGDLLEGMVPLIPHLPGLLGEGGETRTYLVVAANIAELHASGGFTGAVGTITVTDGNISMGEFTDVKDMMPDDDKRGGATAEELDVFGPRCDIYAGDHNCVADFSRAGKMYHDHWLACTGQDVEGVLSFDPVFLQYMLGLVGGVDTSFGVSVDGTNAAPYMLNQCLFWWRASVCDLFYNEVAKAAFTKVLSGLGDCDTTKFFKTLEKAAEQGHCIAWLRDDDAQEALEKTSFAWNLPHDATSPMLGVYVNDWTISKASYYLSISPEVGEPTRSFDGSYSYPVTVTLKNNADRNLLYGYLPRYLRSRADVNPRSRLDLYEQVFFIAPEGGSIEDLSYQYTESAEEPPALEWEETSYQGLEVQRCAELFLDAGESCVIKFTVTTSKEATEELQVRKSPVMSPKYGGWA